MNLKRAVESATTHDLPDSIGVFSKLTLNLAVLGLAVNFVCFEINHQYYRAFHAFRDNSTAPFRSNYFLLILIFLVSCTVTSIEPEKHEIELSKKLVADGTQYMRNGKFEEAIASFKVARDLGLVAESLDGLGCVALLRGQFVLAEAYFLDAQQAQADYYAVLGNLALLYEFTGNFDKAELFYKEALKLDPANYRVRNNYAAFLSDRRNMPSLAHQELLKSQVLQANSITQRNLEIIEEKF